MEISLAGNADLISRELCYSHLNDVATNEQEQCENISRVPPLATDFFYRAIHGVGENFIFTCRKEAGSPYKAKRGL